MPAFAGMTVWERRWVIGHDGWYKRVRAAARKHTKKAFAVNQYGIFAP